MAANPLNTTLSALSEVKLAALARAANRLMTRDARHMRGSTCHKTRTGSSHEFIDFKNYMAGDDRRRIDWRASARTHHTQVRRYHDDAANHWLICLDRSASMGLWNQTKWRLALQLAAAWSYLALHSGNSVGLLTFSQQVDGLCPLGRGRPQYNHILQWLNRSEVRSYGGGSNLITSCSQIKAHCSIVVLSDFLSPDTMQHALERFCGLSAGLHVLQILSPQECLLPPDASVSLRDIESGQTLDNIGSDSASAAARTTLQQLQQELVAYCRRREITMSHCLSDEAYLDVLSRHFKRLLLT